MAFMESAFYSTWVSGSVIIANTGKKKKVWGEDYKYMVTTSRAEQDYYEIYTIGFHFNVHS